MNNSAAILNTSYKKNWEQQLWLSAAIVYAVAEGAYQLSQVFYTIIDAHKHTIAYDILQWLLTVIITIILCFILYRFKYSKLWQLVILNLIVFLADYSLWAGIKYYMHNMAPAWLAGINNKYSVKNIIYDSWFDISNYVLTITAFYVLKFYVDYKKAAAQRMQLAMMNKDMQLNLLNQQLNPHFYFNTLNNLYGLARRNSARLSPALQQLQNIMEYVLTECGGNKVSLQKEIDFLKSYIALERLRYEEDTAIDIQVHGNANGYSILPLLLIQFVENAFKHGMKEKSERNWMQVNINTENEILFFSIDNSCSGTTFTEGIGLSSVKHRLKLQYDGKYDMQMYSTDNKFSVFLKLNLS